MPIEYTGAGGVRHNYGPVESPSLKPAAAGSRESTYGNYVEVEYRFTFDNLPSWSAGRANDAVWVQLPALAVITDAVLVVEDAFVGGTALEVGTVLASSGAAVDVDGLIPAAVGVTANLGAGAAILGKGAQVASAASADTDGIITSAQTTGAAPVLVSVVATGTFTAGRARLIVRYIPRQG